MYSEHMLQGSKVANRISQAVLDGHLVEIEHPKLGWIKIDHPSVVLNTPKCRITKKVLRPWTPDEALKHVGKEVKGDGCSGRYTIYAVTGDGVILQSLQTMSSTRYRPAKAFCEGWKLTDGSPCGVYETITE